MKFTQDEYWLHLENKLKYTFPDNYETIYRTVYKTFQYPVALISFIFYLVEFLLSIVLFPFTIILNLTSSYWLHFENKLKQIFPESYESVYSSIYSIFKFPIVLISLVLYIANILLSIVLFPFTLMVKITLNHPYIMFFSILILVLLYLFVFRVMLRRLYQIDLVDSFLYSIIPYGFAIAYTILDIFFPILTFGSFVLNTLLHPLTRLLGHVEKYEPRAGSIRKTAEVWTEYRDSRKARNRKQPAVEQEAVRSYAYSETQVPPPVPEKQPYTPFRVAIMVLRMVWRSIYFIISLIFPVLRKLKNALSMIFHPVDTVHYYIDTIRLRADGIRKTMRVWAPEQINQKTELQLINEERNDARVECCTCQYNPKSVTLEPCGHSCMCQKCAEVLLSLKEPHCPICRANVTCIGEE